MLSLIMLMLSLMLSRFAVGAWTLAFIATADLDWYASTERCGGRCHLSAELHDIPSIAWSMCTNINMLQHIYCKWLHASVRFTGLQQPTGEPVSAGHKQHFRSARLLLCFQRKNIHLRGLTHPTTKLRQSDSALSACLSQGYELSHCCWEATVH